MSIHPNMLPPRAVDDRLKLSKGLVADFLSAVDAPEGIRDEMMGFAVARARRELAPGGRLS